MPSSTSSSRDWLRDSSAWVPFKVLLKASPDDLVAAGYPEAEVKAFLTAYHELEQAEDRYPGQVPAEAAATMLASSRKLGEAVNPTKYATVAMIDRETHFNAMNPFWQAPIAYGTALALLAVSLGFVAGPKTLMGRLAPGPLPDPACSRWRRALAWRSTASRSGSSSPAGRL